MNENEKYLDAIAAAIEARDRKAMELLEAFATHVYQDLHARAEASSGEQHAAWEALYRRAQELIAKMSAYAPDIW